MNNWIVEDLSFDVNVSQNCRCKMDIMDTLEIKK